MTMEGLISYLIFFATMAGIYAVLSIGLNIQWGYTGLFNIGIAGFFAVGAYTSALLTTRPTPGQLGGFDMPFIVGLLAAGVASGLIALLVGLPTLRLREDYLAIASIGIAETIRFIFQNERWLAHGTRGVAGIPQPMRGVMGSNFNWFYLLLVVGIVMVLYFAVERGIRSPWGRVLKAIREDEYVAVASGKSVYHFKMQSLVLGAVVMGVAGSLYAHFISFISPLAFEPMLATFIVWVMLIVGGSGNTKGAIVGAYVVWGIWTMTDFLTNLLPSALATRAAPLRVLSIGVLLIAVLLWRPQGILGEEKHVSNLLRKDDQAQPPLDPSTPTTAEKTADV